MLRGYQNRFAFTENRGWITSNSEVTGEDRAHDAIEVGFWQAEHFDRSVLKQMFTRHAISTIEVVGCA
ncbi:MAG TPA: hypothetical protein VNO32_40110, partial [Candidatus Acidoferrum sp.]|nr:hypothetical protein [Candidatus Acidoferrum sp.]